MSDTKTCSRCRQVLPLTSFFKRHSWQAGYTPYCRDCNRIIVAEWRAKNPERASAITRRWQQAHPEQVRQGARRKKERNPELYRALARRSHALRKPGKFARAEWSALKDRYEHRCLACGLQEPIIRLVPDHVVPVAKGGSNGIDNIQPLCIACNRRKSTSIRDYREAAHV